VGGAVVGGFAAVGLAATWVAPFRHTALAGASLESPSAAHLLGTNSVGQDVFSQLLLGARLSMTIAVVAGVGTLILGAAVGLLAGWIGGRLDAVLMRIVDLVLAVPRLPLLIVVGAYVGPSVLTIALIISLTSWPPGARVIRSQVLSLRQRTHLRAAVGFGAGTAHVFRRHVIPEIGLILAASLVASAGRAVMIEAGLAFLGLGDPTQASWGQMLRDALDFAGLFYTDAWLWWLLPPIAAISLLLLGITFLGIAVEERVNPRLARHRGNR
jgi:ABC-type dipeptide/oligopeptide/nickel transport system permease subunit